MAGLTAPPDNSVQTASRIIEADGWFPGIDTADIARTIRMGDGVVTDDRLQEAAIAGILDGLRIMSDWRSKHALAGIANLEGVTDQEIAGENAAVLHWRRMVKYFTAAHVLDGHTDVAATDEALDREEEKRSTADMYRTKGYEAVSDLMAIGADEDGPGEGRNRVSLL